MKSPALRGTRVGWVLAVVVSGLGLTVVAETKPDAALERLKSGNDRFVRAQMLAGAAAPARLAARPAVDAPSAAVLSCADAGVPPEQFFDAAPGELVSVRVAGPVADRVVVASLEQAVETLKVSALIVLGHESCATLRAVSAAAPNLTRGADVLADALAPALARAAGRADLDARRGPMQAAVEQTVNDLLRASERLRHHVKAGDLAIVGAYYEAETGRVVFSRRVERVPSVAAPTGGTR